MTLKWFLSKTVRQASAMRKHVQKLLDHQRDILPPQAVSGLQAAIENMRQAVAGQGDKAVLEKQMADLEGAANKWLKPYPNAAWRENVEVLLVALSVAMGIRTFFLQPFKIPTGSMQPTLFGVTSTPDFSRGFEDPSASANLVFPTGWQRVRDWFAGISYLEVKAKVDGTLESVDKPFAILIFNIYQKLQISGVTHWILFPPDYGSVTLEQRAGLHRGAVYKKGDEVVRMKISSGDHLFVDRVSYNFRRPQRGEIVVFDTHGLPMGVTPDTFYIKRLCGLGDETLSLKQDFTVTGAPGYGGLPVTVPVGHLVVNGKQITASDPGFQNVYTFYGASRGKETLPYKENRYFGHGMIERLAPGMEFHVEPQHYFVMGDNTMNSSDSRFWGDFAEEKVIGKSFFVYWPITDRFGWNYR
jgi:signal peptidase I